ncbi:FKBP-type peptidyl-prolyl cis-trans isomerase N-terminal domain-containing protein [Francisella orientalis]|uniref:Peptidyl-prolyl cis-trans isomerase n=1 Tax=Francisella orientalis TaxID=299583 RepID=A0AAP7C5K1_9GAMM|nr:FKBP-type peptidyl-prolyl cis-trans isomerase N-terminal domain-containing protein [Francisella orientalis]AHB98457.1 peptidyl-prolyl cis-trans isomerase [Francisella orientalis LADL 07-285A]AKN85660.1 Peptidyl-prolyl cis-trans isomerase [Francisella orientalis FNO12]AKN87200.1 Peptidyl-prolyl cis-trans isomerase [Francisella orientalis FNO24]AKN88737.1 Peptidyl-prolyl cis-trans isomerase [Francisella orientalis]AKU05495.1 Peptidyl-prolyl cis-trans isomerase [Francisella orientalis]
MKLKKIVTIMSCTVLGLTISSCSTKETTNDAKTQTIANTTTSPSTTTQAQTNDSAVNNSLKMGSNASYVVGYQVGSGIARQDFGLYDKQTIAGFAEAINGDKPRISESQIRRNMETLKDKMIKKQLDIAKLNKVKSDEFMSQIAKMDNAIEVNDGVYYQMIKQGDGKKASIDSTVTIAYKGTTPVIAYEDDKSKLNSVKEAKLIGPSFDSSESATFPLRNLIECWKDAIPKIPNGSTFILYCAPNKAYGTRAPATIGPNQALAFEITLKDFK